MDKVMLKLPPPIWAAIYVLAAAAISWAARLVDIAEGPHSVPIGAAVALAGWIPPIWAVVMFRRAGTEIQPTSSANKALITSGPYRITRNPMYLGLVLVTCGIALGLGAWPMWLAPLLVFATTNFVHIPFEEAKMRRQFGRAFDAYAGKVPRWI